eukprot:6908349-Lingulodinium_polyedra.AAC.1
MGCGGRPSLSRSRRTLVGSRRQRVEGSAAVILSAARGAISKPRSAGVPHTIRRKTVVPQGVNSASFGG